MRIERQNAEYEALSRSYERAREAESAAVARAAVLEKDLAAARSTLESEQTRARDIERTLAERAASVDATTVQVLHSLAERDCATGGAAAATCKSIADAGGQRKNRDAACRRICASRPGRTGRDLCRIERQSGAERNAGRGAQAPRIRNERRALGFDRGENPGQCLSGVVAVRGNGAEVSI